MTYCEVAAKLGFNATQRDKTYWKHRRKHLYVVIYVLSAARESYITLLSFLVFALHYHPLKILEIMRSFFPSFIHSFTTMDHTNVVHTLRPYGSKHKPLWWKLRDLLVLSPDVFEVGHGMQVLFVYSDQHQVLHIPLQRCAKQLHRRNNEASEKAFQRHLWNSTDPENVGMNFKVPSITSKSSFTYWLPTQFWISNERCFISVVTVSITKIFPAPCCRKTCETSK